MKRLCIYQLYDKDGIVDEYIFYWIDQIVNEGFEIHVVSNGPLNEKYKKRLKDVCTQVYFRDDYGFDAMAFRYILIEKLGKKYIENYDECLIINDTVFGPFISLGEIFKEMEFRDCDFWGITHQQSLPKYSVKEQSVPYHIQAYFVVFTKKVLKSAIFWDYWENLSEIEDYEDAVIKYEFKLTDVLIDAGFRPDAFYRECSLDEYRFVDLMERPLIMIENDVPILKKKLILDRNFLDLESFALKRYLFNILLYIEDNTEYDIGLITSCFERVTGSKIGIELMYKYREKGILRFGKEWLWNYRILSKKVFDFLTEHKNVWVYGAGHYAELIIRINLELKLANLKGILVTDVKKNPSSIYGINVYKADKILREESLKEMAVLIAIMSDDVANDIEKCLRVNGVGFIERIGLNDVKDEV